jgi:hypothetical protein
MITIRVNYELGHHYIEQWEESEVLCPFCCAREVWRQLDAHAEGWQLHICAHCWMSFEIGDIAEPNHNMQFLCRKEAITAARSKPVSPQAEGHVNPFMGAPIVPREGLRIPTLQDLHDIFSEEETKLEQQAKSDGQRIFYPTPCPEAEHNWVYQRNTSNGAEYMCNTCGKVREQ